MGKPYKRIIRPLYAGHFGHNHLVHEKYCDERRQLVHAYFIIQKDFIKIMDYVELHDQNKGTFSHRIYELLLRVCTEFESNCKGILRVNNYNKVDNLNITDYFRINKASRLNEYVIRINNWFPNSLEFKPFDNWSATTFTPLDWYQAYNSVKHNRSQNFADASLDNLIKAIGGLVVILHSQYGRNAFNQFQDTTVSDTADDGFISVQDSVFSVKYPDSWTDDDYVESVDSLLDTESDLFQCYNFN